MALESIPTPITGSMSKLDKKTHQALIALGIIGIASTIILWAVNTGFYLEYIRLYNLDPMDWTAQQPVTALLDFLGRLYIIPAMLVALGFYAVIVSSGGKYSLLFVLVMLYPFSFNLYQVLFDTFHSSFSFAFAFALDIVISVGGAVILALILRTTRYQIKKPVLLYVVIILIILNPIISFVMYPLVWFNIGIAESALQWFLVDSPYLAVYFMRLIATAVLFFTEYSRENLA